MYVYVKDMACTCESSKFNVCFEGKLVYSGGGNVDGKLLLIKEMLYK